MTTEELIQRIGAAAGAGDWRQVQPLLAELKRLMQDEGRPLNGQAANKLVEALANGPEFSAAISGGVEVAPLVREIKTALTSKSADRSALQSSWDALYQLLADPTARVALGDLHDLLATLRSKREFDLLAQMADRAVTLFQDDARLRRHYGQALIDSRRVHAGIGVLETALNLPGAKESDEGAEIIGLLGRAYKQLYVDFVPSATAPSEKRKRYRERLEAAVRHYGNVFKADQPQKNYWHGVNLVALLQLARRDGHSDIINPTDLAPEEIASRIVAKLEPQTATTDDPWVFATLGECHLAREEWDKAAAHFGRYISHEKIDAFALASTIRQLEEVHRLKPGVGSGGKILAVLKEAQIAKPDSKFKLDGDSLHQLSAFANGREHGRLLETMVPDGKFVNLGLLQTVVTRAAAVVAICTPAGATMGTGFIVQGGDLKSDWGNDWVVVTNAHVISDKSLDEFEDTAALRPDSCKLVMEGAGGLPLECGKKLLWQSAISRYDCAILPIERKPANITPLRLCKPDTKLKAADPDDKASEAKASKVSVIGYPLGGPLSLSVVGSLGGANGLLVDAGPRRKGEQDPIYLHYRAPTEPGNSGSPVFETEQWSVVALHHAGFDQFDGRARLEDKPGKTHANEGISIQSIRRALKTDRGRKRA